MTFISLTGQRLKEEREALGLSQAEAAAAASVTREHWGRCERGVAIPGGEMLAGFSIAGGDIVYVLTGVRPNAATSRHLDPKEQVILDAYRSGTAEQQEFILKAALGFSGTDAAPGRSKARVRQKQTVRDNHGVLVMAGNTTHDDEGKK